MHRSWRNLALIALCIMLCTSSAAALFEDIERDWSVNEEPTPAPTPSATPSPTPAPTPSPTLTSMPASTPTETPAATFDPEAADPFAEEEQELFDPALYDAPVPKEAYNKRLYILDPQKEMLPAENWQGQERYGWGEMRIPQLFQYDFRKVVCFYYGRPKSVATSGCGATCMSMIIGYLTGNKEQNPYTLFRWAVNHDLYDGSGLTHEALTEIGALYGVGGVWVKPNEVLIKQALRQGYPIVAHMGAGTFTERGHYIVLRGLTTDGRILVNDPNSWLNSALSFEYSEIVQQAKTEDPFFMCYRVEGE